MRRCFSDQAGFSSRILTRARQSADLLSLDVPDVEVERFIWGA